MQNAISQLISKFRRCLSLHPVKQLSFKLLYKLIISPSDDSYECLDHSVAIRRTKISYDSQDYYWQPELTCVEKVTEQHIIIWSMMQFANSFVISANFVLMTLYTVNGRQYDCVCVSCVCAIIYYIFISPSASPFCQYWCVFWHYLYVGSFMLWKRIEYYFFFLKKKMIEY